MKSHSLFAIMLAGALLSGCATEQYSLTNPEKNPTEAKTHAFVLSGIGQTKTINVAEICGDTNKVAEIETKQGGLDLLFAILTFGIYTPRSYKIYCTEN